MATDRWTSSNGNWSTAADWSDGVPQAGDSVVIKTAKLDTITYNSASPSVSVASLTVGDDNFDVSDCGPPSRSRPRRASAHLLEVNAGALNFNSVSASIASLSRPEARSAARAS